MGNVRIVMKGDPALHCKEGEYRVFVGDEEIQRVKAIKVDMDVGSMPMAQITVNYFDLDVEMTGLKTLEVVSDHDEMVRA